jgi:hypothetical protein
MCDVRDHVSAEEGATLSLWVRQPPARDHKTTSDLPSPREPFPRALPANSRLASSVSSVDGSDVMDVVAGRRRGTNVVHKVSVDGGPRRADVTLSASDSLMRVPGGDLYPASSGVLAAPNVDDGALGRSSKVDAILPACDDHRPATARGVGARCDWAFRRRPTLGDRKTPPRLRGSDDRLHRGALVGDRSPRQAA